MCDFGGMLKWGKRLRGGQVGKSHGKRVDTTLPRLARVINKLCSEREKEREREIERENILHVVLSTFFSRAFMHDTKMCRRKQ